jgi:hypothetical protein
MSEVFCGRSLSSAEKLAINAIAKNYPDNGLTQIRALHTADFTDPEDVPSGIAMIHPPNATVHVDSLPLNTFTYLAVVPILSTKRWTDADFKDKEKLIHEAVPQFSKNPPSLKCRSVDTGIDGKNWQAELGEDENAFAGVFKQTKGRDSRYFIAVQAGAPMACKQLRQRIAKQSPAPTFDQLLGDKDYNYCHYIAQRNVLRLAYNVARALKVPVRHMDDVGTHREFAYSGLPMRAVPLYLQPISTIMQISHDSAPAVAVFNKLTPVAHAAPTTFVYAGPYEGIVPFHFGGKAIGYALPVHVGKEENPRKLSSAEIDKRAEGVFCEGNIRTHPDIATDSFKSIDNEEFRDAMNSLGWKTQGLTHMVPVSIKIFNPSIKR